jgi:hypothetical protein
MNLIDIVTKQNLNRIFRFPIRAILGLEPFLLILPIGCAILYLIYKGVAVGLGRLADVYPPPSYALPFSYFVFALFVLVQVWFFISLWSSAGRIKAGLVKMLVRLLVLVAVAYLGLGDFNATQVINNTFASSSLSIGAQ